MRTWPTVQQLQNFLYGAGILSAVPPAGVQSDTYINYQDAIRTAIDEFERDTGINPFLADGSEAQRQYLQITGSPTAGTFRLRYSGQNTGDIAYNASSSTVQTALEGLSSIGSGLVTVTGDAGGPYTVVLDSSLWPYAWITLNVNGFTPSTADLSVDEPPVFHDGPRGNLIDLRDSWWSIRKLETGRHMGTEGVDRTLHTEWEYRYRRGSRSIDGIWMHSWEGGRADAVEIIGRRGYCDDLPTDVFEAIRQKASSRLLPQFSSRASGGAVEWQKGDVREKYGDSAFSGQQKQFDEFYQATVRRFQRVRLAAA